MHMFCMYKMYVCVCFCNTYMHIHMQTNGVFVLMRPVSDSRLYIAGEVKDLFSL